MFCKLGLAPSSGKRKAPSMVDPLDSAIISHIKCSLLAEDWSTVIFQNTVLHSKSEWMMSNERRSLQ